MRQVIIVSFHRQAVTDDRTCFYSHHRPHLGPCSWYITNLTHALLLFCYFTVTADPEKDPYFGSFPKSSRYFITKRWKSGVETSVPILYKLVLTVGVIQIN